MEDFAGNSFVPVVVGVAVKSQNIRNNLNFIVSDILLTFGQYLEYGRTADGRISVKYRQNIGFTKRALLVITYVIHALMQSYHPIPPFLVPTALTKALYHLQGYALLLYTKNRQLSNLVTGHLMVLMDGTLVRNWNTAAAATAVPKSSYL